MASTGDLSYHGGDTFKCEYHPGTKNHTISCLPANTAATQHIPSTSMAQQPNHKGRKRVIFHENQQITTPTAYDSNLNTAQQELLCLHETYTHADMKEIQQQIKKCDLKANRQVATCQIPKCLSCSENKGKKRYHNKHRGSITADDQRPGSNTSIDHVDAANVPRYTWQHKGRTTLKKYKNFMLFVDHKTRLVYPSFQGSKTAT
jgi:hypothetical protein